MVRTVEKEILKDVSEMMKPAMNPALRQILILRYTGCIGGPCGLAGTILLNGTPQPTIFKYVVQDDNVMGTLMEREHRVFSSPLAKMKSQARNEHINKIIEELDMSKVLNSSVGNQLIWGVSRGARKKTPWQ